MRALALIVLIPVSLCGCGSMMEKVVPPGKPTWEKVINAADDIPEGTPKWVVKMRLGTPTESGPNMWHYVYYGRKVAEAKVFFNEKDRVSDVQTNQRKEFDNRVIIRPGRVR